MKIEMKIEIDKLQINKLLDKLIDKLNPTQITILLALIIFGYYNMIPKANENIKTKNNQQVQIK